MNTENMSPLDPSKVKAGDTVTLTGDTAKVEGKVRAIFVEDALVFEVGYNHFKVTGTDCWTLTDHQPAPVVIAPGTTGTATVRGQKDVRVIRTAPHRGSYSWVSEPLDGPYLHAVSHMNEAVTDFVPDESRPLPSEYDLVMAITDESPMHLGKEARTTAKSAARRVLALLRGESR
jgi:hypothetical protein